MALCDRLETAQTERESRRDSLVASSLNRLNNEVDPDAFLDHARYGDFRLGKIARAAEVTGATAVITTEKGAVTLEGRLSPPDGAAFSSSRGSGSRGRLTMTRFADM